MSSLDCLLKGYQIILNKLPDEKKVVFSIDDNLAPSLKDNNAFEAAIEEKGSLQALIGYSDEMCCTIFDIVDQLKNERQFEDGSNALLFLMMLKPFVSGCWIILGELWTEMHRIDDALYAYLVAINCAPFELEPYQYAIRFCLANNHKPEALRILDYGLEFTASHELCSEEEKALPEQLRLIKAYVESVK